MYSCSHDAPQNEPARVQSSNQLSSIVPLLNERVSSVQGKLLQKHIGRERME